MIHKEEQKHKNVKVHLMKGNAKTERRRNSEVALCFPRTIVLMPWETGKSWISGETKLRVTTAEQHSVEWAEHERKGGRQENTLHHYAGRKKNIKRNFRGKKTLEFFFFNISQCWFFFFQLWELTSKSKGLQWQINFF